MLELEQAIATRFKRLSLDALIARIERAPDFGYDDEAIELSRRLAARGQTWRWGPGDRIVIDVITGDSR